MSFAIYMAYILPNLEKSPGGQNGGRSAKNTRLVMRRRSLDLATPERVTANLLYTSYIFRRKYRVCNREKGPRHEPRIEETEGNVGREARRDDHRHQHAAVHRSEVDRRCRICSKSSRIQPASEDQQDQSRTVTPKLQAATSLVVFARNTPLVVRRGKTRRRWDISQPTWCD